MRGQFGPLRIERAEARLMTAAAKSEARPGEESTQGAMPVLQRLEPPAQLSLQSAEGTVGQVGQTPLDMRPRSPPGSSG